VGAACATIPLCGIAPTRKLLKKFNQNFIMGVLLVVLGLWYADAKGVALEMSEALQAYRHIAVSDEFNNYNL